MENIVVFKNTRDAIKGEKTLLESQLDVKTMALPSALGSGCGLCVRFADSELPAVREALAEAGIDPEAFYCKKVEGGQPVYQQI